MSRIRPLLPIAFLLLWTAVATTSLALAQQVEPAIVGGDNAARTPYMARLKVASALCGAVLIDPQWALSAGHCTDPTLIGLAYTATLTEVTPYVQIVAGEYDTSILEGYEKEIGVSKIFTFGYRNGHCCYHDLALFHLAETLSRSAVIDFVGLADAEPQVGDAISMYGWGQQGSAAPRNPVLQIGHAQVIARDLPQHFSTLGDAHISFGDSGGPALNAQGDLVGIASSISGAKSDFTRVLLYRQAIEETIAAHSRQEPAHQLWLPIVTAEKSDTL